ncbi:hypothetical protein M9H77_26180 [Catharanthus roseus]|uniref:Uncharacterized protein n=1 Tax=Catharanthus roseus TaxID=4058 RepID=A0ACC0A8Y7_CATRO|nr:hypothetical protein M9H77_26180 [Catharanthus roseus]
MQGKQLTGPIPFTIFNISTLQAVGFSGNRLSGSLPVALRHCPRHKRPNTIKLISECSELHILSFLSNFSLGSIPTAIFNISALQVIGLTLNNLSGNLPSNMGYKLNNLEDLLLNLNDLSVVIPSSISNASKLITLSLRYNESLKYLIVNENPLTGVLPASIVNLSSSLENIYAARCKIKGRIPNEIGNLSCLLLLDLSEHELIGSVPITFRRLQNLQRLSLGSNKLREPFPYAVCGLLNLGSVELNKNEFLGPIPECLGNITSLREIYLDSNRLTSIPASMWNLKDLSVLNHYSNSIGGSLPPEIANLKAATAIVLLSNQLSGTIPTTIGDLQNLTTLSIANCLNITSDRSALLALKAHIRFDPQNATANWLTGSSVCSCFGVTCSARHQRVTA